MFGRVSRQTSETIILVIINNSSIKMHRTADDKMYCVKYVKLVLPKRALKDLQENYMTYWWN